MFVLLLCSICCWQIIRVWHDHRLSSSSSAAPLLFALFSFFFSVSLPSSVFVDAVIIFSLQPVPYSYKSQDETDLLCMHKHNLSCIHVHIKMPFLVYASFDIFSHVSFNIWIIQKKKNQNTKWKIQFFLSKITKKSFIQMPQYLMCSVCPIFIVWSNICIRLQVIAATGTFWSSAFCCSSTQYIKACVSLWRSQKRTYRQQKSISHAHHSCWRKLSFRC